MLNCSIRNAVSPRKNLAVPIELFISFDSMPVEGPYQLHLRAAIGYIELGMFEEANAELEEIDPFCRTLEVAQLLHSPGVTNRAAKADRNLS
jgi:hypothetical protein